MYYILGFLLMHFRTAFAWLIKWSTDTQPSLLLYVNDKLDIFIIIGCSVINERIKEINPLLSTGLEMQPCFALAEGGSF